MAEAKFRDISIAYEHLLRAHKDPSPGSDGASDAGGGGAGKGGADKGGPAGRAGSGGGRKSRRPREDEAHCINC